MNESIHGHDVMRMMLSTGKHYTMDSLEHDIIKTFGVDARFHTCSAEGMTARELIEFLQSKGKFVASPEGFQTRPQDICQH